MCDQENPDTAVRQADKPQHETIDYGTLKKFEQVKGWTSQVVFVGSFNDKKDSNHEIQFGWYGCDFKLANPQSQPRKSSQQQDSVNLSLSFHKIVSKTSCCHMNQKLLGPWNFRLGVDANWTETDKKWPLLTLQFHSETCTLYIGQQNCQTLKALAEKIRQEIPNADQDVKRNKRAVAKIVADDPIGGPLEQNYVDDLRAGAFHFVEKREIEWSEHAKPYQVIFTESPPAMTWIYPKPRTLSRLSVFPVPFVSADKLFGEEEEDDLDHDIVSCTLEYWDQCLKSFRAYSTFCLSEQELCHLDLPLLTDRKKLAVSDVWRIVVHGNSTSDRNSVKPQSLVSVIRVDSFYSPLLIPKLQVSLRLLPLKLQMMDTKFGSDYATKLHVLEGQTDRQTELHTHTDTVEIYDIKISNKYSFICRRL